MNFPQGWVGPLRPVKLQFFTVWVCLVAYFPFDPMRASDLCLGFHRGGRDRAVSKEGFKTGHTAQSYLLLVTLEKLPLTLLCLLEVIKQLHGNGSIWPYPPYQVIPGRHCLMQVGDGTSVHDSRSRGCKRKGWNPEVGKSPFHSTALWYISELPTFHLYK